VPDRKPKINHLSKQAQVKDLMLTFPLKQAAECPVQ
jgi:hypothetical protein